MSRVPRGRGKLPVAVQLILVAIVFAVAFFAFVLIPAIFSRANATPAAAPTPQPLPSGFFQPTDQQYESLEFAKVKSLAFPSVDDTEGTIAAADDATTQVFSPFTGRVVDVYATVGDIVIRGAPLFRVVASELPQAQNDLLTAERSLDAARVQLRVTADNRARLLKLVRVGGAARKDVEQSAADLATARTTVQNDEIAVALVRSRYVVLDQSAGRGGATGDPGKPLTTTVLVRAPITGIVTQRAVGAGQNVDSAANGASNPLLTISDYSHVFFVAAVRETAIETIAIGAPVAVSMAAFPDRVFNARVNYIAPAVDPMTHRLFVRAEVANPDGQLKPGMFGTFRIGTAAAQMALGVPEMAVVYEGDTARVWIAGPHKSLALRNVTVGKTIDGIVEVRSGLQSGDRVVTSGSVFIDRAASGDN